MVLKSSKHSLLFLAAIVMLMVLKPSSSFTRSRGNESDVFGPGIRRRPGYVRQNNSYSTVYDDAWTKGGYPSKSCWGCRFVSEVVTKLKSRTVLDAGTGNGAVVRYLRSRGFEAYGIEQSEAVLRMECPDLLNSGIVEPGVLTSLPYADDSFDLVFSADVLEHLSPDEAESVVKELIRVSRRDIFLSISLKSHTKVSAMNSSDAFRHTLLRPRSWWEDIFGQLGAEINTRMIWAMQETDMFLNPSELFDCRKEGDSRYGGWHTVS